MREKPELTFETIKRMEDMTWFTHARIFDDLLVVAQKETACYIWKTIKGLVVFDGIWPDPKVYEEILNAIKEAGWEQEKICKFVMTHGHIDHVGCGRYLAEYHHAETYLSKEDDRLRVLTPHEEGQPDDWKEFTVDHGLQGGDQIDCGDKRIEVISTPGHTKGCMSFIFPVYEDGKRHMASLFGGATAPWDDPDGKAMQKAAIRKFQTACAEYHADVALTNHTAFDNGLERIAYSQVRMKHLPNIYIIGENGVQNFLRVYEKILE